MVTNAAARMTATATAPPARTEQPFIGVHFVVTVVPFLAGRSSVEALPHPLRSLGLPLRECTQ
jgi:hypothetical protein